MKTIHYPNKIRSHLVTIVPMAPFTPKSTSKLRYAPGAPKWKLGWGGRNPPPKFWRGGELSTCQPPPPDFEIIFFLLLTYIHVQVIFIGVAEWALPFLN